MESFEMTWQVSDGYTGGARPQHVMISADEIEDDMDADQLLELLEDVVQGDFENKIAADWHKKNEVAFLEWAQEVIQNRKEE